jgi:hypothetical protein
MTEEEIRLTESGTRKKHWKRWGPYLSERAWGTVREDYSRHGNAWEYLVLREFNVEWVPDDCQPTAS